MERLKDFIVDLSLESGIEFLHDKRRRSELKRRLSDYVERQAELNELCSLCEEIDFFGLSEGLSTYMIKDFRTYLFDKKTDREKALEHIMSKAAAVSGANSREKRDCLQRIICGVRCVIENFYREQLEDHELFLSNMIVDEIVKQLENNDEFLLKEIEGMVNRERSKTDAPPVCLEEEETIEEIFNRKIQVMFQERGSSEEERSDPLVESIGEKIISRWESAAADSDDKTGDAGVSENLVSEKTGKHFSLVDPMDVETLVFQVHRVINMETLMIANYPVLLDSEAENDENGTRRTYYITDLSSNGNLDFVLLSFDRLHQCVTVSIGIMGDGDLRISKRPMTVQLGGCQKFYKEFIKRSFYECTIEEEASGRAVSAADGDSNVVIIDTETLQVVKRRHTTVDLIPYRRYFVFRVGNRVKATPFDIGCGYYWGKYGLERNLLKAALWLEKSDCPSARYLLALIFRRDPLFKDEGKALACLEKFMAEGKKNRSST